MTRAEQFRDLADNHRIEVVRDHRQAHIDALAFPDSNPGDALNQALNAIAARYGERTTSVVAMQLEYPGR